MSSNFVGKSKHPIVYGKQALIFGKHTQIFGKHLPLFRYHVLHFERAEYEQKEPRQVPVRQVLASYFANFQHFSIIPLQQPVRRLTNTDYQ